jgi:hypothetical protein
VIDASASAGETVATSALTCSGCDGALVGTSAVVFAAPLPASYTAPSAIGHFIAGLAPSTTYYVGGVAGVYTIAATAFAGAISATSDAAGLISLPYGPGSLAITIASCPQGRSGEGYGSSLSAAGGTAPYSWSIAAGALPTGLAIVGAEITGTPTTAGDFPFTLRVDDAADHSATADFTITILAPVAITTTSLPAGIVGTP